MSRSTKSPNSPATPDFLTVEEASRIARIGRTTAYEIAHEYETTAGVENRGSLQSGGVDGGQLGRSVVVRRGSLALPTKYHSALEG